MKRAVYTAEHEAFRKVIRDFIASKVTPCFAEWEADGRAPREIFRKLGELGVTGFGIPEEYGGSGDVGHKYDAIISEETARAGVALSHYRLSTGIVLPYLVKLANDEQKRRWLPGIASGDILLCIAMSEPGTGSDLAGIRTTAKLSDDGSHYVLNGAKTFISGSRNAELCIVVARTAPATEQDRRAGLSLLVVPTDRAGFAYGRSLDKIGMHSSDTNELSFADVEVPVENLLGEEGKGFAYLGQNLPRERLTVGVGAVASARAAIEMTRDYVRQRTVFGKPMAAFQNAKFVLAECDTEVSAAQAMVDKALDLEESDDISGRDRGHQAVGVRGGRDGDDARAAPRRRCDPSGDAPVGRPRRGRRVRRAPAAPVRPLGFPVTGDDAGDRRLRRLNKLLHGARHFAAR